MNQGRGSTSIKVKSCVTCFVHDLSGRHHARHWPRHWASEARRERRLRSLLRHERIIVRMNLATALHHSVPKSAGLESHTASRGQIMANSGADFFEMIRSGNSEKEAVPHAAAQFVGAGVFPASLGARDGRARACDPGADRGGCHVPEVQVVERAPGVPAPQRVPVQRIAWTGPISLLSCTRQKLQIRRWWRKLAETPAGQGGV